MEKIQSLLLGLINDLYSFKKEVLLNEEKKNIIYLFSNEKPKHQQQKPQPQQKEKENNQDDQKIKKFMI